VLLVAFAFGGFEMATVPAGESRNPRRDVPRALFLSIAGAIALYSSLQLVLYALYPGLGASTRPIADAAGVLVGDAGAALVAAAAVVSTTGYLFGAALTVPRISFALAEQGQFPPVFARVHARYRTPWAAIVLHAVLSLTLALGLGFIALVVVNVTARLVVAGVTCAALLRLRHHAPPAGYRCPLGLAVPLAGLAVVALLLAQVETAELGWGIAALAAGALLYPLVGRS
jgi:amino acid transporter